MGDNTDIFDSNDVGKEVGKGILSYIFDLYFFAQYS